MRNPGIHVRVPQKLLNLLQREAKRSELTIPALIRRIIRERMTRKRRERLPWLEQIYVRGRARR